MGPIHWPTDRRLVASAPVELPSMDDLERRRFRAKPKIAAAASSAHHVVGDEAPLPRGRMQGIEFASEASWSGVVSHLRT